MLFDLHTLPSLFTLQEQHDAAAEAAAAAEEAAAAALVDAKERVQASAVGKERMQAGHRTCSL